MLYQPLQLVSVRPTHRAPPDAPPNHAGIHVLNVSVLPHSRLSPSHIPSPPPPYHLLKFSPNGHSHPLIHHNRQYHPTKLQYFFNPGSPIPRDQALIHHNQPYFRTRAFRHVAILDSARHALFLTTLCVLGPPGMLAILTHNPTHRTLQLRTGSIPSLTLFLASVLTPYKQASGVVLSLSQDLLPLTPCVLRTPRRTLSITSNLSWRGSHNTLHADYPCLPITSQV